MPDTSPHIALLPNDGPLTDDVLSDGFTGSITPGVSPDSEPDNRQYVVVDIHTSEMYGLVGIAFDGRSWVFATQSPGEEIGTMRVNHTAHRTVSDATDALIMYSLTGKDD